MAGLYAGTNYANIRVPKSKPFYCATDGFTYNHSTEATKFGLREDAILTLKRASQPDISKRGIGKYTEMQFEAKLLQSDFTAWQIINKLAQNLHNLWVPFPDGDFLSFTRNTSTNNIANGTALVGLHAKFEIDADKRGIDCVWKTRLFPSEMTKLAASMAAILAGTTSGTALTLASLAYDRSKFRNGGFRDITIGGNSVGAIEDAKLTLETIGRQDKLRGGREISWGHSAKAEITLSQSMAAELTSAWDASDNDYPVGFNTNEGETITFSNGAITPVPEWANGSEAGGTHIKLMLEGEIQRTYITYSSATALTYDLMDAN